MDWLTSTLYEVSNALLVPCVGLLVLLFGITWIHLGAFLREWIDRRRRGPAWAPAPPASSDSSRVEEALDRFEMRLEVIVERTVLPAKVGPMLGLAGTLIPLGPALKGMAAGNVALLSQSLIVAFTTAVVGLAIAGPCFWISTVRKRWYSHDLTHIARIWQSSTAELTDKESPRAAQSST